MKVVAFDTETKGLDWFDPEHQAFLATWADEDGEYCANLQVPEEAARFRAAMDAADVVVAHNLPFDAHQVTHTLGFDPTAGKVIHDTSIMSQVIYPEGQFAGARGGHKLKNLAKVYLRDDAKDPEDAIKAMAKAIGLRTMKQTGAYHQVWQAYPDVMEEYAVKDARYTFDLFEKFQASLGDLKRVYDLEMEVMPILIRAEDRGVRVDQDAVQSLKARYETELVEVQKFLEDRLGAEALGGPGSDKALTDALLSIGVPLHRKTDTGQLATHKFALQEFADDFDEIEALEEMRRLERFLSTYIGAMDGRETVHTSFRQLGAWTGRMSATRPNVQNMPKRAGKEVRSVFIPREGMCFVVADYESIEAKLLAYYLGDQGYRDMLRNGHDPHAWMAAQINGGEASMYAKGSAGEKDRDTAKNTTFAISYGAGGPRVSDMNKISLDEAKALISKIKSSLPGYYRLMKRVRAKIESVGYVSTIIGRKQIVSKEKAYVGLNALIQGSAADIMKIGLVAVDKAVTPLGGIPLLVVHDEVVVECPIEHAEEVRRLVDEALCSAWPLDPPLTTESSIVTTSYADA